MTRYVLRRLLGLVPTLLVIVVISFFIIRLAPGSPFGSERSVPPEVLADLQAKYRFDRPMPEQLWRYLAHLAQGDLGLSTKYPQRSVNEIIAVGFPATLLLGCVALVWPLLLGISAGVIGAVRQNTRWDYGSMTAAMVGISVPTFVLGPLLVLIFSLTLFALPAGGWGQARGARSDRWAATGPGSPPKRLSVSGALPTCARALRKRVPGAEHAGTPARRALLRERGRLAMTSPDSS